MHHKFNKTHSISRKLLKVVFTIYFSLTILMTAIHIMVEYEYTKNVINEELECLEKTFKPAITTAMWELNSEQLKALTDGIYNLAIVTGVEITDNEGHIKEKRGLAAGIDKVINSDLFYYQMQIYREFDNKQIYLGKVRFYSDSSVIINRVKMGFMLILLNAVIKSSILIILFLWAFQKYLFNPISRLTQQIERIDLKNIGDIRIDLNINEENELKRLERSFNKMLNQLQIDRDYFNNLQMQHQDRLERQVNKRTGELEEAIEELNKIAFKDSLTHLKNRRSFFEEGKNYMSIARRVKQPMSLLMVDLDYFKSINDTYGHMIGDRVLIDFAEKMSHQLRESDLFARIGGEEFTIILNNTDCNGAKVVAEKMCRLIENSVFKEGDIEFSYTISIGVTDLEEKDKQIDDLIRRADIALYRAKEAGRNQVQLYCD